MLIIRDIENNYIGKLPITVNSVKIQEKRLYFSVIQCYNIKDTGVNCIFMPKTTDIIFLFIYQADRV